MIFPDRHLAAFGLLNATCALFFICPARAQVSVRVLSNQIYRPGGIVEGVPGAFYVMSGNGTGYSVTTHRKTTEIATVGSTFDSPLVRGANGKFYSADLALGNLTANVFSIPLLPGNLQQFPPQAVLPTLSQNLPDGKLLGTALNYTTAESSVVTVDLSGNVTEIAPLLPGSLPA